MIASSIQRVGHFRSLFPSLYSPFPLTPRFCLRFSSSLHPSSHQEMYLIVNDLNSYVFPANLPHFFDTSGLAVTACRARLIYCLSFFLSIYFSFLHASNLAATFLFSYLDSFSFIIIFLSKLYEQTQGNKTQDDSYCFGSASTTAIVAG